MMNRLNWDDTRLFLALARHGTLSGAARELGIGLATISRRVERMEHALGLPLFLRHQNGYDLTDQGAALLPRFACFSRRPARRRSRATVLGATPSC